MGDIGDYWREHKEYKERKRLGLSEREYKKMMRDIAQENRSAQIAKHTIRCECGRTFMDDNAHKCHKSSQGKKGHSVAERMTPPVTDNADNWTVF